MSIWIKRDRLTDQVLKDKIAKDLTVVQLDEMYETMKKQGRILPGYTVNPDKKIYVFDIDDENNLHLPYHYAKHVLKLPSLPKDNYPLLSNGVENKVVLRDNQLQTAKICFKQLIDEGTTTVGLPPGYGKTYIGAHLSFLLGLKVLIIVPREPLLRQWEKTFNDAIPTATTWIVGQKATCPEEIPDVTIALDPRISKIPRLWREKIGTLIIDEAHMIPTRSRISNLLSLRPYYIILETATMVRGDDLHKICQLIGGSHGVFKTAEDPYTFKVVDLNFITAEERTGSMGIDYTSLCSSLSEIDEYNRVILNIVKQNPTNKFIILTRRVEHGDHLVKLFHENDIPADTMMGTKKSYVNSRVLIGTFSKIGTGFDEKSASIGVFEGEVSDSLIICHSVKSDANFDQFRGRVMRNANPTIYWLNVGNKVIRGHLRMIKKRVEVTGGKIVIENGKKYMYSKPPSDN